MELRLASNTHGSTVVLARSHSADAQRLHYPLSVISIFMCLIPTVNYAYLIYLCDKFFSVSNL